MKNFRSTTFWSWSSAPIPENAPPRRNLKIEPHALLNLPHIIKITLYAKHGNSPKLGPKAMKLAFESSFYLKIKNESNRLIGMVGMIEHLSSTLPPSTSSKSCFKKSWDYRFCNHLEIFIFVLTCVDCKRIHRVCQKSNFRLHTHLSQKYNRILENGEERVQ